MRNNLVKEREHKACGEQIALTIGLAVLIAVCVVALLFLRKQREEDALAQSKLDASSISNSLWSVWMNTAARRRSWIRAGYDRGKGSACFRGRSERGWTGCDLNSAARQRDERHFLFPAWTHSIIQKLYAFRWTKDLPSAITVTVLVVKWNRFLKGQWWRRYAVPQFWLNL